ncbi:phosphate ABC transporter permease subunit PstC [Mesorhizobium microcysteis]|uniref:Phosphate transport system permease protein n=1 Tax=Neoaquamicrobium microcysteis TaxID=2682781 RepID=A0A5D4H7Q7_9HYPH|nr:phosphate ABC transporter permease subunit PstC [Mesorhizobium microcysteis]TYR34860.1 phosphate ABC transporter permease subunit PstC [Mesorhizobium microcysteis]
MNTALVAALLLLLLGFAYQAGWSRSRSLATTGGRLHSRPVYHGSLAAIWALVPALLVLALWTLFGTTATRAYIIAQLPAEIASQTGAALEGAIARIRQIESGFGVVGETAPYENAAAQALREFRLLTFAVVLASAAGTGAIGLWLARRRITTALRARNEVEKAVRIVLIACSVVAILTTVGIVASLLSEAIRFFTFVSPADFFFGTVWNPRFSTTGSGPSGEYGLLPLLWGTLMVAGIAIAVALPIGLMTAIYLSQYARPRVRSTIKPIVEVLAGIPTIVYGFFALVTVGPFLATLGQSLGLQIRATSALTAGVVMGIMIIPFISSLSDDVIRQVPRAMRDGSLGLGATKSETIKRVILPAALPGIVGAFLLAVSRAIGETMIVVLAAGNSPYLRLNPGEPVSTVTVTIVNQLTGDTDFASPQSLVAFALGLTLFAMTLVLNVAALYIVRRYREQYE